MWSTTSLFTTKGDPMITNRSWTALSEIDHYSTLLTPRGSKSILKLHHKHLWTSGQSYSHARKNRTEQCGRKYDDFDIFDLVHAVPKVGWSVETISFCYCCFRSMFDVADILLCALRLVSLLGTYKGTNAASKTSGHSVAKSSVF